MVAFAKSRRDSNFNNLGPRPIAMDDITKETEKVTISKKGAESTTPNEAISGPSKNALKKAQKELEKQQKRAEKAKQSAEAAANKANDMADCSEGYYGNLPLIQSTARIGSIIPCDR